MIKEFAQLIKELIRVILVKIKVAGQFITFQFLIFFYFLIIYVIFKSDNIFCNYEINNSLFSFYVYSRTICDLNLFYKCEKTLLCGMNFFINFI
jgi:hypothetical protein